MHDRLPPKGMCSRDHCKFWEIILYTGRLCQIRNISEMVQDRDMVAMKA